MNSTFSNINSVKKILKKKMKKNNAYMINCLFLFCFEAQKYINISPNTICISISLKKTT